MMKNIELAQEKLGQKKAKLVIYEDSSLFARNYGQLEDGTAKSAGCEKCQFAASRANQPVTEIFSHCTCPL